MNFPKFVMCPAGNMYDETNMFAVVIALLFTGLLALLCYLIVRDIHGKYVKYVSIAIIVVIVILNLITFTNW